MTAGQESAMRSGAMPVEGEEVDGFSVTFWLGDTYRGNWEIWTDADAPGELSDEEQEMWALVRALRVKIIGLYGPNGSKRENFVFPERPPWG